MSLKFHKNKKTGQKKKIRKPKIFQPFTPVVSEFDNSEVIWLKAPVADSSGYFIPTLNQTGFMTTQLDEVSQEFTEYAGSVDGPVLEVGAAYGIATLTALAQGAKIICNDIDPRHLMIVKQQAVLQGLDTTRLEILRGDFKSDIELPPNCLEAVLMCRVLHLFDGPGIERSLYKAFQFLKPGGKIFVVADTPYLGITASFIPEYQKRIKHGAKWPGLISNAQKYFNDSHIPNFINLLDPETLTRSLEDQGFIIEKMNFIERWDFPENRRMDGRESIGVVAYKPTRRSRGGLSSGTHN